MRLTLAHIAVRNAAGDEFERLAIRYIQRIDAYYSCEALPFRSETSFLEWTDRRSGRTPPFVVLLDGGGRQMTSEAFAGWIAERRDQGVQHIVFAVGPASGWSDSARARVQLRLSLGTLTLAHALARLVLAEQVYRACTILAGHPYHSGH